MTGYTDLVIVLWLLPALIQIILPLLMLIGYCLARAVSMALGRREIGVGLKKGVAV